MEKVDKMVVTLCEGKEIRVQSSAENLRDIRDRVAKQLLTLRQGDALGPQFVSFGPSFTVHIDAIRSVMFDIQGEDFVLMINPPDCAPIDSMPTKI